MEYNLNTPLKGSVSMTASLHENKALLQNSDLYKFIWIQEGTLTIEVDHVVIHAKEHEIISLTPLHHMDIKDVNGRYLCLLFNSNFYCIYGHDNEVSCNGLLFNGSSNIMRLQLTTEQARKLYSISNIFMDECVIQDNLQEEMLRIVLKRFIITCTRIAREKFFVTEEKERSFDLVRQFYVLVDNHYKEKKQVQDYAELLRRSPKTISNLFAEYNLPTPLHVIHDRIEAEAKRLILYSSKNVSEIADILGFDDVAAFSRFFKKSVGISVSDFRKTVSRE